MQKVFALALLTVSFLFSTTVQANGLTITNLSRDSLNQTVTFDLAWNNSWRLDATASPSNWDAAWVFVKFLPCDADISTPWTHGSLSPSIGNHSFGNLEPVLSDGSATGLDTDLRGVLLRRSTQGLFGNAAATTVTLNLTNMVTTTAYHVRVVGIEMVYIPTGSFEVGGVEYASAFSANNTYTDPQAFVISSENSVTIPSHNSGLNANVILDASFPKGFDAFHIMKYEITAGQYASFLNSLPIATQFNRYPGNFGSNRNSLQITGTNNLSLFGSLREDRAQNYLGWDDIAAYLDWSGLRPMTELEFEKACRGTNTVVIDEYPWGTTNIFELTAITSPEDGAEIPGALPANANYINNNITAGDGGRGPVRAGLMALPSNSTREQSGAGFYGVMELGGNVSETCVAVDNSTAQGGTITFTGTWGDGALDNSSSANVAGWPMAPTGLIRRGGAWDDAAATLRTADRSYIGWNGDRSRATGEEESGNWLID